MADILQLNTSWLSELTNPHHDGTTQQIDDFVQAFVTDNQIFNQKKTAVHQARLKEDEVWLKSQRDAAVPLLEGADKRQDGYISGARYILTGHAGLPDGEPTQQEAKTCLQVFKDFNFSTHDAYGAEADKIIQMQQNLQPHQSFMQQIGAWTFLTKAVEQAQLVRQYLGQRAQTKGEFVKGEMKAARRATDQAIAELYKTLMAMQELMPTEALTTLITQLKGIELYAKQYYIAAASGASTNVAGDGTSSGGTSSGGTSSGGTSGGSSSGGGDNNGGGDNTGGGDNGGGSGGDNGGGGSDNPGGSDEGGGGFWSGS